MLDLTDAERKLLTEHNRSMEKQAADMRMYGAAEHFQNRANMFERGEVTVPASTTQGVVVQENQTLRMAEKSQAEAVVKASEFVDPRDTPLQLEKGIMRMPLELTETRPRTEPEKTHWEMEMKRLRGEK
ncbi:MAG TPA: hypothetical protein VFV92_03310 [Candidatus Bathyarchaeia archaeon]|nr:hypothetical protein [Candidatus Bathyarchaeia archaeon]